MHAGARLRVKSPGDPPTGLDHSITPRSVKARRERACRSQTPLGEARSARPSLGLFRPLAHCSTRKGGCFWCVTGPYLPLYTHAPEEGLAYMYTSPQEMGAYLQVEVRPYSMDRPACC